jgi:hypothetical protein
MTRDELAASRSAQESQAVLASFNVRSNTLNIELSAVAAELTYYQSRIRYLVELQDSGRHVFARGDLGETIRIPDAIEQTVVNLKRASQEKSTILADLDELRRGLSTLPS